MINCQETAQYFVNIFPHSLPHCLARFESRRKGSRVRSSHVQDPVPRDNPTCACHHVSSIYRKTRARLLDDINIAKAAAEPYPGTARKAQGAAWYGNKVRQ